MAHHTVFGLHHCRSTADAHEQIPNIEVFYKLATTDHIPVCTNFDVNTMPILSNITYHYAKYYLDWSGMQQSDINNYGIHTEQTIQTVHVSTEAPLS